MAKLCQMSALFTLFVIFHCYDLSRALAEVPSESVGTSTTKPTTSSTNAPTTTTQYTSTASVYNGETESSLGTSTTDGKAYCDISVTIGNYCQGFLEAEDTNGEVLSYFNTTTNVDDILHMIIHEDAISALGSKCETGVWCLSDSYHEKIYQGMSDFYRSPICNQALWNCLESIADIRQNCDDIGNLFALLEVLSLLCDMNALKDLQPECYTRTVEMLNLLYSDEVRGAYMDLNGPLCADYTKKVVKSFLCTTDACGLKQTVFLKEFDPLVDVALNSEMVFVRCQMDNVCPDNTTLAPRLDFSQNVTPENETALTDDQILEEELKEEDELDKVFDELEKELEEESNLEEEGMKSSSGNDKDLAIGDIGTVGSDAGVFDGDAWFEGTTIGTAHGNDQDSLNVSTFTMGGDTTILFGIISLTVLAFIGLMVIMFLGFRHYRRTRRAAYKKGYSQLSEEESRMLTYE